MNRLIVAGNWSIRRVDIDAPFSQGPIFHRWLPDGRRDAVRVPGFEQGTTVHFWFERYGRLEGSMIMFDGRHRDVDPAVMDRQGKLEAGPLFFSVEIADPPAEEVEAIAAERYDSPEYDRLGKRVVKKNLDPIARRFLQTLRFNFGQYWLDDWPSWDSREMSLGNYCHLLNMKWRIPPRRKARPFMPTSRTRAPIALGAGIGSTWSEYLSKADWRDLETVLQEDTEPSIAVRVLIRAHELLEQGELRAGVIECATALEIAVDQRFRQAVGPHAEKAQTFFQLPLATRVIASGVGPDGKLFSGVDEALKLITVRNEIVHEGVEVPSGFGKTARATLELVRQILGEGEIRLPTAGAGNLLVANPSQWESRYKNSKAPGGSRPG